MAERMGADYVELANTQFLRLGPGTTAGQLMPSGRKSSAPRSHAALPRAVSIADAGFFFVVPDYSKSVRRPA